MTKDRFQLTVRWGRDYKSTVKKIEGAGLLLDEIQDLMAVGNFTSFSVRDLRRRSGVTQA